MCMSKPMLPLFLACAMTFALSGTMPVSALAATAVETAAEGSTESAEDITAAGDSGTTDVSTDADGQIISTDTADAIDNADLGADQIGGADSSAAAEKADTAISVPDSETESSGAMEKSAIGSAFDDESYLFTEEDTTVYLLEAAEVLQTPDENSEVIGTLDKYDTVQLTGSNELQYWEISYEGETAYIDSSVITRDESDIEALRAEDARRVQAEAESRQSQEEQIVSDSEEIRSEWEEALEENDREQLADQTRNPNWSGAVLSPFHGSVYGPSGKETYYNLNMSGCISNMNSRGYYAEVWVRNDGCKMFGNYIMCAANLSVHPYGSLVESSLGTCIVVDTGSFAAGNPNQLDIAVTW